MTGTAYCQTGDLLNGSIPLPSNIDPQKIIQDAADEIDSKIGYRYVTPIDLTEIDPTKDAAVDGGLKVSRPVRLSLKRINAALATGRIILAVASPQEQAALHAYGLSLVNEAAMALEMIRTGQVDLDGVDVIPNEAPQVSGPQISNLDPESNVEAFYNRIAAPPSGYGYGYSPRRAHDGFVG